MTHAVDWSTLAIRLLQGVVYQDDDAKQWEVLLANTSALAEYFAKIGLGLVIDEADAMAYLRQSADDLTCDASNELPRLFRRVPLSYESTLLCVLLRDELHQFEENDVQNERCVVVQGELLELWKAFFPADADEVRLNRSLGTTLRKLEELKFVKLFETEPPSWEIRRIIKARLPLADLEQLKQSMLGSLATDANEIELKSEHASENELLDKLHVQ